MKDGEDAGDAVVVLTADTELLGAGVAFNKSDVALDTDAVAAAAMDASEFVAVAAAAGVDVTDADAVAVMLLEKDGTRGNPAPPPLFVCESTRTAEKSGLTETV